VDPVNGATSDTALGDWYVNRTVVDRRPLLLLVSSASLVAVVLPARNVRELPGRLAEIIGHRLGRLGVPRRLIDAELQAMAQVRLAKTENRSVLGILVDFAKMLPHALPLDYSDRSSLMDAEEFLWDNPCFAGKSSGEVVFPRKKAPDLLRERWDAG
jgi:hypothetical protein